uniref:lysozyme n=1 Tax=Timema cristinae TaxID=61476 RepID=A0A7R9CMI4_TIMCR|nr:unnamed protein product [Timema cristinae]
MTVPQVKEAMSSPPEAESTSNNGATEVNTSTVMYSCMGPGSRDLSADNEDTAVRILGQQENKVVDDLCLGCLCEAMSDCNRTFSCAGDDCGLFMITRPYWEDAGRHVIAQDNSSSPGAFQRCVVDPFCAAATVEGYMKTYSKDCNGNGAVDCEDFFALHFLGAGCEGDINQASPEGLDKLRVCQEEVAKIKSGN